MRVHDRRPGRDARRDGTQLRGRHERRHRLRARPGRARSRRWSTREMVELEDLSDPDDQETVLDLVRKHVAYTGSARGRWVLDNWDEADRRQVRQDHAARLQGWRLREAERRGRLRWPMGDVRGFMKYHRAQGSQGAGCRAAEALQRVLARSCRRKNCRRKARGAWIAAFRFATPAARWETSFPTGTTWCIAINGSEALDRLHATNNFPEFTGRVCPAPCEAACVLGINEDPVAIKQIECRSPIAASTKAGSRPSRRRCAPASAWPSSAAGRPAWPPPSSSIGPAIRSRVFERADRPGGLLMYGIPDFKLEKWRVWRRIEQMEAEGVEFRSNANVGVNVPVDELRDELRRHPADRRRHPGPRSADSRPRTARASISPWNSCRSRTRSTRETPLPTRSWPPAST